MDSLENRITKNIDGPGIYFVEHINDRTLSSLKNKLKRTIIGVLNDNNKQLSIEIKGYEINKQELSNIFMPFTVTQDETNPERSDFILDCEKFLYNLFRENSKLSKKYIVLVDISVLDSTLRGEDGSLIKLQIA